jgi:Cysteine dioxygenase type I
MLTVKPTHPYSALALFLSLSCPLLNSYFYMYLDKIGYHRVGNPSDKKVAVSLHLYTPAFDACTIFVPGDVLHASIAHCSFDTRFGLPLAPLLP